MITITWENFCVLVGAGIFLLTVAFSAGYLIGEYEKGKESEEREGADGEW